MTRLATTACLLLAAVSCSAAALNERPIIGIWAYPYYEHEYIAASYVKWIESAGGRAVPIPYNSSDLTVYDRILAKVNGILLPGGAAKVPASVFYTYKKVAEINRNGGHFPVWGTCLGSEWLAEVLGENDQTLLKPYAGQNISLSMDFTAAAASSRLFGGNGELETRLRAVLANASNPVTMNNHEFGVDPQLFTAATTLGRAATLLATSVGTDGRPFMAAFEASDKDMYTFAVQWHPEKNNFEFGVQKEDTSLPLYAINHSPEAVWVSQAMANFFVLHAKQNNRKFPSFDEEQEAMVYNYPLKHFPTSGLMAQYMISW